MSSQKKETSKKIKKIEEKDEVINTEKNVNKSKLKKVIIIIGIIFFVIALTILIICLCCHKPKIDKNNDGIITDNEKLSKYYDVYKVDKKPIKEGIKINGKKVNLIKKYYSIKFKEIHELKDVYIVEFEVLFTKKDDTYNGVLYAISKDGKVLWYENPKSMCDEDDSLCRGVIGYHFSEDFDYYGHYYKINDNKITFVSEVLSQDPVQTACHMNYNDDFTVEYEIEYLGDNKFDEMKKIRSLSAGQYIDREKDNGAEIICD